MRCILLAALCAVKCAGIFPRANAPQMLSLAWFQYPTEAEGDSCYPVKRHGLACKMGRFTTLGLFYSVIKKLNRFGDCQHLSILYPMVFFDRFVNGFKEYIAVLNLEFQRKAIFHDLSAPSLSTILAQFSTNEVYP